MKPVSVRVINQLPLGLAIKTRDGQSGIVRVREISWDSNKLLDWRQMYPVGWEGKAILLPTKQESSREFSLRLVESDPWDHWEEITSSQTTFKGIVTGVTAYGAFIEIVPGLTGLLHESQFPDWAREPASTLFWPGDSAWVVVREVVQKERKISLALAPLASAPVRQSADPDHLAQPKKAGDLGSEIESLVKPNAPRKRILLVEDQLEQSTAMADGLRRLGQRVDVVQSAEAALDVLGASQPDIAVIDVGLPGMNGAELANLILDKWPQIHVVNITDWTRAVEIEGALEKLRARGADILTKPIQPDDILLILKGGQAAAGQPGTTDPQSVPSMLAQLQKDKREQPLQRILQKFRQQLGFQQAVLFSFDPVQRAVSILKSSGEGFLSKHAIPQLVHSPVRDVAEDHKLIRLESLQPSDHDLFRYLLELRPDLVSCIGVPIQNRTQTEYALFALDAEEHEISDEQMIYAEAIAMAIGTILEQRLFEERAVLIQRAALVGILKMGMMHDINNLVTKFTHRLNDMKKRLQNPEASPGKTRTSGSDRSWIMAELVEFQGLLSRTVNTTRMYGLITKQSTPETLRVDEMVKTSVNYIQALSKDYHVAITFTPPEHMLVISSQAAALEQVMLNVLLNAMQQIKIRRAGLGGWAHVWIEPPFERGGASFFNIVVEDNGPGVHAGLWETIFDAGYTTREDGSGIGLYISRRILEDLGGRLYVRDSQILGGTTFVLEIPNQF